jgi:hypothetical protein
MSIRPKGPLPPGLAANVGEAVTTTAELVAAARRQVDPNRLSGCA